MDARVKHEHDGERGYTDDPKEVQYGRTERLECSADTKLFFDDAYKLGTRGEKQRVDVLQYGRSLLSKCTGYTQYFLSDVYTNSTRTKKAQVETVQCGRSMIEMLGVLAIVGVLSVGGIAGYSKAMEKFKINKTIDQVSHIVANIRTLYAQQTTYIGLNNSTMGIIPGSSLTNAFGGEILISHNSWYTDFGYKFLIAFTGVSDEACISLATYDWGDKQSAGLIGLTVAHGLFSDALFFESDFSTQRCILGESNWYEGGKQAGCIGTVMPVSTAASACNCGDAKCGIVWLYQ